MPQLSNLPFKECIACDIQNHRLANVLDHADGCVTLDKLSNEVKSMLGGGNATVDMEKINAYLDEQIDNIPAPDWNQGDETKKDYIKNRTHYHDVSRGETIAKDGADRLRFLLDKGAKNEHEAEYLYGLEGVGILENGRTYEITFADNTYTGTLGEYEDVAALLCKLDEWRQLCIYDGGTFEDNGVVYTDVYIVLRYCEGDEVPPQDTTLSVTPIFGELKQLDTKFIPDYVSKTYVDEMREGIVDDVLNALPDGNEVAY